MIRVRFVNAAIPAALYKVYHEEVEFQESEVQHCSAGAVLTRAGFESVLVPWAHIVAIRGYKLPAEEPVSVKADIRRKQAK